MADSYIHVTHEDFAEKVLNSPDLVIVNFSADQIMACKIQDPEFEAVSREYSDRVTFARLNVNEQNALTQQWNVDQVPALVFFKNGNVIYRISGIVMRDRLRRQIEGVLLAN
jgi:thioredoxin 1